MKIYNTLSGKKEAFTVADEVKMYVCGPTVYNLLHVGNMRCYVVFDTARRFLLHKGYTVRLVQNFTDVDDKIIQQAEKEGISPSEVAEKYIAEALKDADTLCILRADHYPRVTTEMDAIIQMIETLIEKGHAYVQNGHVFFSAQSVSGYGKLSKKNVEDLLAGARVQVQEDKKSPVDFVLWKPQKTGEPDAVAWPSPWGPGRPGWHIECSAMAKKYLGDAVDIHGGGADLIFPHHENEIAQSEAANGTGFVRYWMHNGLLTRGHKKMSKSAGGFSTLREVVENFPPEVVRFFLLSVHYRMPMEYSEELLESAQSGLNRIKNCRLMLQERAGDTPPQPCPPEALCFQQDFNRAMEDDFNTADAIAAVFGLVKFANTSTASAESAAGLLALLDELCGLLGLQWSEASVNADEAAEIDALIAERQAARAQKNWAEADRIRDMLTQRGIVLEDTPEGVRWKRT